MHFACTRVDFFLSYFVLLAVRLAVAGVIKERDHGCSAVTEHLNVDFG